MSGYIGLDTSNYTTSVAFCDKDSGVITQQKKLLPVQEGKMGLRQSDAVFHHTRQLPDVLDALCNTVNEQIVAVAASDRPQQRDGSYMPCFLVGAGAAREWGTLLRVPVHFFTHQQGHVAAALYGADALSLRHAPFLAFHVSGGTTDALYVQPDKEHILHCEVVGHSLDLKAGQLIDRVGGMLGLPFPAGPALEALANTSETSDFAVRVSLDGTNCHLSGVENQCKTLLDKGAPPADVAKFCLCSVNAALAGMTDALLKTYGTLPLVYAGGVMSNAYLKESLSTQFGGYFAPPQYSADNAAGIALLCKIKEEGDMCPF